MKTYEELYKGPGSQYTDKPNKHSHTYKHLLSGKRRSKIYKQGGA